MAKKTPGSPTPPSKPFDDSDDLLSSPSAFKEEAAPATSQLHTVYTPPPAPEVRPQAAAPAAAPRPRAEAKAANPASRPAAAMFSHEGPKVVETRSTSWPFWAGLIITGAWFAGVVSVVFDASGTVFGMPVTNVALGLAGAVAPPALLWMIIAYLQRATDIRAVTEPLRRQLQMVLGTGSAAENRVRRFNDALERQLELLRQAGDGSYDVLQSSLQVLQEEEQAIHVLAERSAKEVARTAGVVRDNSEVLESLLHNNRENFNDLSARIADHIATLDERSNEATARLGDMVDQLQGLIGDFILTADKKLSGYTGVSDQISQREKETAEAAQRMTEMLEGARAGALELNQILTRNHDVLENTSQRLLARMQEVNATTEHLAAASDAQEQTFADKSRDLSQTLAREIAALDTLTGRLETQIAATTDGLGAHADRLEEKQINLANQATHLLQGLEASVQSMEISASTAYSKFAGASEAVQAQSALAAQHFQDSSQHYENVAEKLESISRNVADRVADIGQSLSEQTISISANAATAAEAATNAQAGVSSTLERLEIMIARIFDAETKAKSSAGEVTKAYSASLDQLQDKLDLFGQSASGHLGKLAVAQEEFDEAGSRLAERARQTESTFQSLVDSAARQQDILQTQLRGRIEEATALLNENAVAIEAARDSLYNNIEAAFTRAEDIKDELKQLGMAVEAPFEEGVRKVQTAVQQGQYQINQFIESLGRNAQQLNELNGQLAEREEKAGHKAAETLAGLDAVAARIEAIQHENMQATQEVLMRLSSLAQQLQTRMGDLSTTAEGEQKKLAEVTRQLSMEINGLIHDSQSADSRVRIAAAMLSEQAGEVRSQLEGQAEIIGNRLDDLKVRFAGVAEQMQEIGRINDTGIDGKVEHLSQVVREAAARLEGLGVHIDARSQQLGSLQGQMGESGRMLDTTTQQALDRLSIFTHALVSTQSTSAETAQQVFARLNEMQEQFGRQIEAVADGSQAITHNMRGAVAGLVEQSVALAAASEQAEARVNGLTEITQSLQERAQNTRLSIEIQINTMQARLHELLGEIQNAGSSLESNVTDSFSRTDEITKHFQQMTDSAFTSLGIAAENKIGVLQNRFSEALGKIEAASTGFERTISQVFTQSEDKAKELQAMTKESFAILGAAVEEQSTHIAHTVESVLARSEDKAKELQNITMESFASLGAAVESQSAAIQTNLDQALSRVLGDIESASVGLERHAAIAFDRSEGMARRFEGLTEAAFTQLGAAAEQVSKMADGAIAKVTDVNAALTEQAEKVTFAGVHLAEVEAEVRQSAEQHAVRLEQLAAEAGGKALYAAEEMRQQIARLREEAETMLSRVEITGQGFNNQAVVITGAATEIENSLQRMQESSAILGEEGRNTAEKIAGQSVLFRRDVEEAIQGISATGDAMEKRGDFAISMLHQMAGRFAEATQNLSGQFEAEAQHLQGVSDAAQRRLEDFGQRLTHHTDRLDSMAGTLSNSGQQIGEALEKANFLLRNLSTQTDRVKAGVQEIGGAMLQRLSELLCTFEDEIKNLTSSAGNGMDDLERRTDAIGLQLRARSREIADGLREEMNHATAGTSAQLEGLQMEFRETLSRAAEVLVNHLRQVQESGAGVMEVMHSSTLSGAEQALQVLSGLRTTTEKEVQAMGAVIQQSLGEMEGFSNRIRESLAANSTEASDAAAQIFAKFRSNAEQELQGLLASASGGLHELQSTCEALKSSMHQSISEAEEAGQNFGRVAEDMREAGQKAVVGATEASQGLVTVHAAMQRSHATLADVAHKSNEAFNVFNDNLTQHTRQFASFHGNLAQISQSVEQTDTRLESLHGNMERIVTDLVERLNNGLFALSRQVLSVREEAEHTVQSVGQSAEGLGEHNNSMARTASVLARALSELEGVSRSLSESLMENTSEVEKRTETLEAQAERLRQAGQTASTAVDALGTRMQSQLANIEKMAMMPVNPPSKPIPVRPPALTPAPAPAYPPQTATRPAAPPSDDTVREMMQRLKEIGDAHAAAAAGVPPAVPAAAPAPAPARARRSDNDLVASLSQIIQQLEDTAVGSAEDAPAQRKAGK